MRMTDLPIFARLEDACACVGIEPRAGRGHFTATNTTGQGKHGRGAGRILQFSDGKGGMCFNWRTGAQALFYYDYDGRKPSREELRKMQAELSKQRAKYERETAERHKAVGDLASMLYANTDSTAHGHAYLRRKCLEVEHPWRDLRCISIAKAQELINQAAIKQEDDSNQVLRGSGRLLEKGAYWWCR